MRYESYEFSSMLFILVLEMIVFNENYNIIRKERMEQQVFIEYNR